MNAGTRVKYVPKPGPISLWPGSTLEPGQTGVVMFGEFLGLDNPMYTIRWDNGKTGIAFFNDLEELPRKDLYGQNVK